MSNHYLYLDTETTSLVVAPDHVWEIGYAIDDEEPLSAIVAHLLLDADVKALEVGNYWQRMFTEPFSAYEGLLWEDAMKERLTNFDGTLYLVGANPAFDHAMLQARWGVTPWHYRMIDVETYAMSAIGTLISDEPLVPQGLFTVCETLRTLGWDIPLPDHSAAGDVLAVRAAFKALTAIYSGDTP